MPADYLHCVESYKKKGVSPKVAKARCAAWFYKKHGYTVKEAHDKMKSMESVPIDELRSTISEDVLAYVSSVTEDDLNDIDQELVDLILKDLDEIESGIVIKEADAISRDEHPSFQIDLLEEFGVVEIVATKVGAKAFTADGLAVVWTKKALDKSLKSWKFGRVSVNHRDNDHGRILDSFMIESDLHLVLKVDDEIKSWLIKAPNLIGVSIEATSTKINKKQEIVDAKGTGVTFVFPPEEPACKISEGCGIIATCATETPPNIQITYTVDDTVQTTQTQIKDDTLDNISEKSDVVPIIDGSASEVTKQEEKGAHMTETQVESPKEGEKKAETVCATLHAKLIGERDAKIEALSKENELYKEQLSKIENEKRDAIIAEMKSENIDTEMFASAPREVLEKVLVAVRATKKAAEAAPVVGSGVVVKATEQKTDESGEALSKAIEKDVPEDTKILEATWKAAKEKYNLKRPLTITESNKG